MTNFFFRFDLSEQRVSIFNMDVGCSVQPSTELSLQVGSFIAFPKALGFAALVAVLVQELVNAMRQYSIV